MGLLFSLYILRDYALTTLQTYWK